MEDNSLIGKIHAVKCEDFVTYNKASIYPGEYLNVIIGPNGSGKSTLVAAIVLGLGGNPKILSRTSNIEEYIKNGKDKANIEIEIYKNSFKETKRFSRSFDSTGKSTYMIDNSVVKLKDYLASIKEFNIQINNLCQFLPQDRVQDFAKMNPQEVLLNTLSSVGTQEMMENFDKLKEIRNLQENATKGLKSSLDKLKDIENRNAQLKEQIDRMEIRKKLENDIIICENKKIWIECMETKKTLEKTQEDLNDASTNYENHKKRYDIANKELIEITKKKDLLVKEKQIEESTLSQVSEKLNEFHNKSEEYENSICNAHTTMENKKKEIVERKEEIKKESIVLSGLIVDLKAGIRDLGPPEMLKQKRNDFDNKLMELKEEYKTLMELHRGINRKLDEQCTPELHALKRKIASLESVDDRKLSNIRDNFEHAYKAIKWLRQNRDIFEGRIYEPMILELNINSNDNSKYIENVVNTRDLLAFTCEEKSDLNTLIKHLCNDMGLKINVLHSDSSDHCLFESYEDFDCYRRLGFISNLKDMLDGPAPILNYLCKVYSIHTILAGTEEVEKHATKIPKNIQRLYFAGNNKITTMYSKYSGDKSTMRSEISSKNLLSVGVDVKEIDSLKNKLKEIIKNSDILKNRRTDVERKLSINEVKRQETTDDKKKFEKDIVFLEVLKEKIQYHKQKIERLEREPTDIEELEKNFKNLANDVFKKSLKLERTKIEHLTKYQVASEKYHIIFSKIQINVRQISSATDQIAALKKSFENSRDLVKTIQTVYENLKTQIERLLKNIKEICRGYTPNDKRFPYKNEFSELPNNLNDLEDMILEMQAKVNCMQAEDQTIYDEYKQRQIQIDELRSEIESSTHGAQKIVNEMENIHSHWFPKLMEIIQKINTSFGKFMTSMDYVGEVQLYKAGDFDYGSYGIHILVKYRNDAKLQALDRFVQSGGERAVAIAIYTLSLQRLSNVPFRCVDEINQGMDSKNERKVFDMLVDETSQPGHSQYFFITPKLLANLNYNEYMKIHIVYNGSVPSDNIFSLK